MEAVGAVGCRRGEFSLTRTGVGGFEIRPPSPDGGMRVGSAVVGWPKGRDSGACASDADGKEGCPSFPLNDARIATKTLWPLSRVCTSGRRGFFFFILSLFFCGGGGGGGRGKRDCFTCCICPPCTRNSSTTQAYTHTPFDLKPQPWLHFARKQAILFQ